MKKSSRIPRVRVSWVATVTLGGAGLLGGCAPPPGPQSCPAAVPRSGDACAPLPDDGTCGYDPCFGDHFTQQARCVDGRWSVSYTSCNPPRPSRDGGED